MSLYPENDKKFAEVKSLHLPEGEYAITSSGPIGVRDIRQIGDIDMVVSERLWNKLATQYGVQITQGFKKIVVSPTIDVFSEQSFPDRDPSAPTAEKQIKDAEIINGIAFVNLRHILYFKETMGREKDKADIIILRKLLNIT